MNENITHRQKGKPRKKGLRPPKKITERYLYNSGLYYLQRFTSSTANFKKVMMRKIDKSCHFHKEQNREDCLELLNKVAEQFVEAGLLDDKSYTRAMVTSYRRSGLAAKMIAMKLKSKGLPNELISKELTQYDDQENEDPELKAAVKSAYKKKIGPFSTKPEKADEEKFLSKMARAGFSYDICKKVLALDEDELSELSESVLIR